ncbi:undecaprenyldiphospho-muramoylpentapeptide beta-N-acetylglucosaminyltransferase [Candidatus Poribacteria bacterium]|nr:undecaprenyldiphospho-muramoylpentapeptide beta-N-acetylglucosaminyltransferase [Candidatus Poribacteria bacterium]MYK21755.1 undecaprenyldiphospho-muramoylpentapeptide beta-N-acetylglucosaminyltransferase [Candidatus Poribacteria bacterium]
MMATSKRYNTTLAEINSGDVASAQQIETHKKVVVAGGGTGGHIYPAIGIAQALQRMDTTVDIVFIGGADRLEATLVPQHSFRFLPIPVAGFPRRLTLQWFTVIWKVLRGLFQSLRYMKELKPDVVIGTGGYVSGPVLLAALLRKIPIAIQEQNASAGLTNGILARWAKAVYLAMESTREDNAFRRAIHIEVTGNPIRPAIAAFPKHEDTYRKFGLLPDRKTIFVMGGSQGARAINEAVVTALPHLAGFADHIQIVHQTGKVEMEAVQTEYERGLEAHKAFRHCVRPFFDAVEEVYSITDIMVCRAGGMTVAEVTACGIPAIFIPLPSQTGNDQVRNAYSVAEKGAAVVLEQGKFTVEMLVETLTHILLDQNTHEQMVTASRVLGKPHASDDIAKSILSTCTNAVL